MVSTLDKTVNMNHSVVFDTVTVTVTITDTYSVTIPKEIDEKDARLIFNEDQDISTTRVLVGMGERWLLTVTITQKTETRYYRESNHAEPLITIHTC